MLRYNVGYQNYNPYTNYYTPYPNTSTAYYQHYTTNIPMNHETYDNKSTPIVDNNSDNTNTDDNYIDPKLKNNSDDTNTRGINNNSFKLGPLEISKDFINIFGFSIQLDDLILVVLILFLFIQSDCDYILILILGLLLFNISFDIFKFFN